MMTRSQYLMHALGIHDWHTVKQWDGEITRKKCGPHDPQPGTQKVTFVEKICCQCGDRSIRPWSLDWY